MAKVTYINYNEMKPFYTVDEVAELLKMNKQALREKCEEYEVAPRRNEIGEWGFVTYDVRKLHNLLYHEGRSAERAKEDDPWS